MSCCQPCACDAIPRIRLLTHADETFDALLPSRASARLNEAWYQNDATLTAQACVWSDIVEVSGPNRLLVELIGLSGARPLLTVSPLDSEDRPLCRHVFRSASWEDSPPNFAVNVTETAAGVMRVELVGPCLGYPVPATIQLTSAVPISREPSLTLLQFATPGQPQVWEVTLPVAASPSDTATCVLTLLNRQIDLDQDFTAAEVEAAIEAGTPAGLSASCTGSALDLYVYAQTVGLDTAGPQIDWSEVTLWLTLHDLRISPPRLNVESTLLDPAPQVASPFCSLRLWLNDLDIETSPSLFPRGFEFTAAGAPASEIHDFSLWLDPTHADALGVLAVKIRCHVTQHGITASLTPYFTEYNYLQVTETPLIVYQSAGPIDTTKAGSHTLTCAGLFVTRMGPDGETVLLNPYGIHAASPTKAALAGTPLWSALPWSDSTMTLEVHSCGDATAVTTGWTVTADGWDSDPFSAAPSVSADWFNGTHLLLGDTLSGVPAGVDPELWSQLARQSYVPAVGAVLQWFLVNRAEPLGMPVDAGFPPPLTHALFDPQEQYLFARINDAWIPFRAARAVTNDDPDTVTFARWLDPVEDWEPDPSSPPNPPPSGLVIPDTVTLRVGPARPTAGAADCSDRLTPLAFTLQAGAESHTLLRRANEQWAAHVTRDDEPDELYVLSGLHELRLWRLPPDGPRALIALYRSRPLNHPAVESFQPIDVRCDEPRELTLHFFGPGYDATMDEPPAFVRLTPLAIEPQYTTLARRWNHTLERWELESGDCPDADAAAPPSRGLPPTEDDPDRDLRETACPGPCGSQDAGVIFKTGLGWIVFSDGCSPSSGCEPVIPEDDGEPDEIRRVPCTLTDPPPPSGDCLWESSDGLNWDTNLTDACDPGTVCDPPEAPPEEPGDIALGTCRPVDCAGGECQYVWLGGIAPAGWIPIDSTCPGHCVCPGGPGFEGAFLGDVISVPCHCPGCTP